MLSDIIALLSVDYVAFFAALVTVIVGFIALKELAEKFCTTFGIKLRYLEEKKEMKKCQTEVKMSLNDLKERQDRFEVQHKENMDAREEFNTKVMQSIADLKDNIDNMRVEIERREARKRFKKLRYDLLNYSDKIVNSEYVSADMMAEIKDEISEYHNISEKYSFENNRVNVSISIIEQKYDELLKAGKVVTGDNYEIYS